MKKTLSILSMVMLLGLSRSVMAQVNDKTVEQLMVKRTFPCPDIYYNTIILIPQLYREGKMDTINAIIDYTHRNCELYTATVAYVLLRSIQAHTFREVLNNNAPGKGVNDSAQQASYYEKHIIAFLNSYILDARRNPTAPYNTAEGYALKTAGKDYTNFIQSMAASLAGMPGLTPVEQFLVALYAHPESARFGVLKTNTYKGTLLQKAYNKTVGDEGVEYYVFAGKWQPFGKLETLGSHPSVGCYIGSRQNGFSGGMAFSVAFDKSPNTYRVKKGDSVFQTDRFVQYYIGYDFAQALYSTQRTEFTLNAGLGYDGINALKNIDSHHARTLGSFNWNLGAGFKVFLQHREHDGSVSHTYIGLQAKYNFVSYNNPSGTDLGGRSACFGLIFGGFSVERPVHYEKTTRMRFRCWG